VVKVGKGYKVIILLNDANSAMDVNVTWKSSGRELHIESGSFSLALNLSQKLKDKIWNIKDPVVMFSTNTRALKIYFYLD